ncbi:MAG: NAD(P)-dependent oxidoreductase [Rhizobiales bacterium 62-17]|nr:NAD-dependent epimerase/dehydratase family protein [Hyphomicrobiales bacterium]OJY00190.1 MAG: NAD(P)-dependent oxidoreductase [Rhizobiales bacterium 62-17]
MNLFVFGLGYSSVHYIRKHAPDYDSIAGTVTTEKRKAELTASGIKTYLFSDEGADDGIVEALGEADIVLVSVPPGEAGDPVLAKFALPLTRSKRLRKIIYLSTVGVYGDRQGEWVDEATAPLTTNARSLMRLAAENLWRAVAREGKRSLYILRLAGIYGPGRNALVQLRDGKAKRLVKKDQVFNRIHVDDIAQAIAKCVARDRSGEDLLLNIADGHPTPAQDVVTHAANLMKVEPPPVIDFETAELSEMARSFYAECKRVSIEAARFELGFEPIHPTYREGLQALWEAGEGR